MIRKISNILLSKGQIRLTLADVELISTLFNIFKVSNTNISKDKLFLSHKARTYPLNIVSFKRTLEETNFIKSYAYFIINAPIDIRSINWCHKSQVLPVFTLQIFIIYVSWGAVSAKEDVGKGSAVFQQPPSQQIMLLIL